MKASNLFKISTLSVALTASINANADQQILDDLIVVGSSCIGQDCVNGESFGFDTLRLKENNLRIKAQDTSTTASFPSRDWQITFNDSTNGGANKFSIDDIDGSRTPFTIEAGAPSDSLYIEDSGQIGLGTNAPVADIHVKSGNTPTLRLEQDGSSGFTPQTWDLAGNEANLFVRDATNGSNLPFRIYPGAPTNSIAIEASGDVGLGTNTPSSSLHVRRTDGTAKINVEELNGTETTRTLLDLKNNGASWITMENTARNKRVLLQYNANEGFNITLQNLNDSSYISAFVIDSAGNVTINGDLHVNGAVTATGNVTPNTP